MAGEHGVRMGTIGIGRDLARQNAESIHLDLRKKQNLRSLFVCFDA